jgi:hypothetical protein
MAINSKGYFISLYTYVRLGVKCLLVNNTLAYSFVKTMILTVISVASLTWVCASTTKRSSLLLKEKRFLYGCTQNWCCMQTVRIMGNRCPQMSCQTSIENWLKLFANGADVINFFYSSLPLSQNKPECLSLPSIFRLV